MTNAEALELMLRPNRWVLRVILPLVHTKRLDAYGGPQCGFLAIEKGARVYLGNVSDFGPGETISKMRFDSALARFSTLTYLTHEAILADGWRVD